MFNLPKSRLNETEKQTIKVSHEEIPLLQSRQRKYTEELKNDDVDGSFERSKDRNPPNSCFLENMPGLFRACAHWKFLRRCNIWLVLTAVAIFSSFIALALDFIIEYVSNLKLTLICNVENTLAQYFIWIGITTFSVWFATGFSQVIAPKSDGSGIPEVKAIIKGVEVGGFLTFECIIAKFVGLILLIGGGDAPVGKEAPFIHIAACMAILLTTRPKRKDKSFENNLLRKDVLISACATGLSAALLSPIGSFLFVLEINSTYFSLRHYWHGFYGAACSTILATVWHYWNNNSTSTILKYTSEQTSSVNDGLDICLYVVLGVICGFGGVMYVRIYKLFVTFVYRKEFNINPRMFIIIFSILVATVTFPERKNSIALFKTISWAHKPQVSDDLQIWSGLSSSNNKLLKLSLCCLYTFLFSIFASALKVPLGLLTPCLKIGALIGLILGNSLYGFWSPIFPGTLAIAGAAAFAGSVTHAISIVVIVFEITGDITHLVPVMISLVTANSISFFFSISLHDTIMLMKGFPYLPNLMTCGSTVDNIFVDDFMKCDVQCVWNGMSYHELQKILAKKRNLDQFPLVDDLSNRCLLGSIQRSELFTLLENKIGHKASLRQLSRNVKITKSDPCIYSHFLPHQINRNHQKTYSVTSEEKRKWREMKLAEIINFHQAKVTIDSAPFQLVEGSSLLQVHSLFVMVGIHIAYVTNVGELVGVVGLKELRKAMEDAKKYKLYLAENHENIAREPITRVI